MSVCSRSLLGLSLDACVHAALRILWKKNEVADYEATTFSIFYNNTLFLVLVIIASFFLLKNFNPSVYPSSRAVTNCDMCLCRYTVDPVLSTRDVLLNL